MSPTPEEQPFGVPPGDVWNDVPLFREIQRVLMSSSGPVNWELARQVGIASASWGTEDPAPSEEDRRGFDEAVRVAELQVAGLTGLEAPSDIPRVEAVRRGQWVQANIEGLRALLEPAAAKIGDAIAASQRDAVPEQAQAGVAQMLGQVSPLLLGAQVGTVLGTLAQQVLGQYDIAVPRPDGAGALFPDLWEKYVATIPEAERSDMVRAYYRRLTSDDPQTMRQAAKTWSIWEGATSFLRLNPDYVAKFQEDDYAAAFARIECHYFINNGFFETHNQLIEQVNRIRRIPAVIVQGRYDVVCPVKSAWDLHCAWPEADLRIVPDAGHSAFEPGNIHELISATDRFAKDL